MSVNPDIVQSRMFNAIAKEIVNWIPTDWSVLYAQDRDSVFELRDIIVDEFISEKAENLMDICPTLVDHLLRNKGKESWDMVAIAVDNYNGMYHPLRLTKMVMGASR